jgi:hypothetical protein
MRTASQRIAKYNARMLSSLVDPTLSAVQALQQANFTVYVNDFYPLQLQLRALLNALDLAPWVVLSYEAFNGEMYAASKSYAGTLLASRATLLCDKWSDAAHLTVGHRPHLVSICLALYNTVVV